MGMNTERESNLLILTKNVGEFYLTNLVIVFGQFLNNVNKCIW